MAPAYAPQLGQFHLATFPPSRHRMELLPPPGSSVKCSKLRFDPLSAAWQAPPAQLSIQLEASLHHLNHRPRRCIQGRTPCECFHDPAQRLELPLKARKTIFQLLSRRYCQTMGAMESGNHHHLGSNDFTSVMCSGVPSWTVLAIEAPLNHVRAEFLQHEPAKAVHKNVPQTKSEVGDSIGVMVPAVRVIGSSWTVILRSLHALSSKSFEEIRTECRDMCSELKTRGVYFIGEATLFYCGYELFESGQQIERAGWEINSDKCQDFVSTRRKLPTRNIYDLGFADEVFRELGIYIPVCHGKKTGKGPRLGVLRVSVSSIETADLIELKEW